MAATSAPTDKSDTMKPAEPINSPTIKIVSSSQSSRSVTDSLPSSLPPSPNWSATQASVEEQPDETSTGEKARNHDFNKADMAPEASDTDSVSEMESLAGDLAAPAILDYSDGGLSEPDIAEGITPLPSPTVDANESSLRERMDLMKTQARAAASREAQFEGAKFLVDNVQRVPRIDQKSLCEAAVKVLKRLAQKQLAEAQYFLGALYVTGIPGFEDRHEPNYEKAVELYAAAAKQGHPEALFHLGLCCENGVGTRSSWARAVSYYRKAASSNHPGAMFRMGMATLSGELGLNRNYKDGVKWLKLSAKYASSKYPQAIYELALLHDRGVPHVVFPDHNYLIELLTRAAELGHAPSQFKLAEAYEYGNFGVRIDAALSVHFYSLAAAQGHLEAMFELGGWYLTGACDTKTGYQLEISYSESMRWVSLAASHGLPRALFAMGYFYENGIGVEADMISAWLWYEKAAQNGDPKAQKRVKERSATAAGSSLKSMSECRPNAVAMNFTAKNGLSANMADSSGVRLEEARRNSQCVLF